MDILQQSLQAADILSGDADDLFSDLGLTFNAPLQSSDLPNDIQALTNQDDPLYNHGSGTTTQKEYGSSDAFDASELLNTTAPIDITSQRPTQKQLQLPLSSRETLGHVRGVKQGEIITQRSAVQYGDVISSVGSGPLTFTTHSSATLTMTVAQNVSIPTCASVFSKAPTRTITSTALMQPSILPTNAHAYSVHPPTASQPVRISTPIQVLQTLPSHVIQQQGGTQLVTLVQKPAVMQLGSGSSQSPTVMQNVNGLVVQPPQNNLAVLKIASSKPGLNLNDPQVIKAITANLVQKQQSPAVHHAEVQQQSQPQFIKVTPNNSLLNVISQRPNQPNIQGTQQITLPNGKKILVNNGQHMQVCTTQSSQLQQQVDPSNASAQAIVSNSSVQLPNSINKGNQVPIKGIQIASVNIPIISSAVSASGSAQGNAVLTIPVVTKHDGASATVNSVPVTSGITNVTPARIGSAQSSSTVRGLLANVIQKQNNVTSANGNNMQAVLQLPQPGTQIQNGPVVSAQGQGSTAIRLNLPAQQRNQLSPAQLQNLLKQHQESVRLKSAKVAENNGVGVRQLANVKPGIPMSPQTSSGVSVPGSLATLVPGSSIGEKPPVHVFTVDASISQSQVDEVKKLLTSRTIASKLHCLSKEQQQLVLAFQAQIKTMSPPVQQYYLRNPQLFMQKVLQQTRNGKPFILHVKADSLQKAKSNATVPLPSKPQHPTISLTPDSNRSAVSNNRISTPPMTGATLNSVSTTPKLRNHMVPTVSPSNHVTAPPQIVKTGVKRPAPPDPPSKVTLVVEQLDCHKKMVLRPDCVNPFVSVRDAIRRLVPYHTCNIPSIDQATFDESDKIFDEISERIVTKTRAMIDKYHLLRLRDSTRDACSADMVMIERMFLQKEKAKYAQDKARLKDDPSLITEYFPPAQPKEECDKETDPINMEDEALVSTHEETPPSDHHLSKVAMVTDEVKHNNLLQSGDTEHQSDNHVSKRSLKALSADDPLQDDDPLLQEAVDSILM